MRVLYLVPSLAEVGKPSILLFSGRPFLILIATHGHERFSAFVDLVVSDPMGGEVGF